MTMRPGEVDHFGVVGDEVVTNLSDVVVLDEDVGPLRVGPGRHHGDHLRIAQQCSLQRITLAARVTMTLTTGPGCPTARRRMSNA